MRREVEEGLIVFHVTFDARELLLFSISADRFFFQGTVEKYETRKLLVKG
jgi:hypothetical protein